MIFRYGFPFPYKVISCTTNEFFLWILIVNIFIASICIVGLGYVTEHWIIGKIFSRDTKEFQDIQIQPIPTSKLMSYCSLGFFISGIILPFLIYNRYEESPSIVLWVVAQILALVFGIISRKEKLSYLIIILAILALVIPVLAHILFSVQATEVPM